MNKIITLLLALALFLPCAVEAKKKQAEIAFDETVYNFGTIPEKGGPVTHVFNFRNTGDANLVIIDAKADCGCTEPKFPAKPVAPGGKGYVKVTFDPQYRPGAFNKVVTIRTNAKQKKVRLKITGTVNRNK